MQILQIHGKLKRSRFRHQYGIVSRVVRAKRLSAGSEEGGLFSQATERLRNPK